MSLDQTVIERTGYTILDLLSDVGGLLGILISGTGLILSILNHNYLNSHLISKLFTSESVALTPASSTQSIRLFCIEQLLPSKLVCCREQRKETAMK